MAEKTPKYQHIKNFLVEGIRSGGFTDQVPSENQLAVQFGVSRMTARRALDELERDGSVDRMPGKGTFIRKYRHYTRGFFRVRPFRKWAEDIRAVLKTKVLEARLVDPPRDVAAKLETEEPVIILKILNYFDDVPVRYSVRRLRADLCAGILDENLEEASIHDILINKFNLPMTRITQSLTAIGLSEDLAPLFEALPGHPVFYFQRLAYSYETPVTYVEYFMRGEMAFEDTFVPLMEGADFDRK
jgi:GntR family transcriptional regulator